MKNLKSFSANGVSSELHQFVWEPVDVTGPILEGQQKVFSEQNAALNIKYVVAADQIGSSPDLNAAKAVQRILGITLERDQGEGQYVLIRGTSPNLISISFSH